jgi:hypothetical protein
MEVSDSQGASFDERRFARLVSAKEYCQPHAATGQVR